LSFSAEFKYDGQRAQIHAERGEHRKVSTRIFSRHLEDMTTKVIYYVPVCARERTHGRSAQYPDVVLLVEELLQLSPSISSFIMDAEIVASDPTTEELKSFQELSNRARKDVQLSDIKVAVSVFVFDLLYLNGEVRSAGTPCCQSLTYSPHPQSYLQRTFRERRQALKPNFPPHSPANATLARLRHVESCESDEGQMAVQEFWERALESRCEGLMVKVQIAMRV
jgi:DNA ligase-1